MQFRTLALACAIIYATDAAATEPQPPDVVVSDANGDTASGTGAMLHLTPGPPGEPTAQGSSAFGAHALENATGISATAIGYESLQLDQGIGNTAVGVTAMHGSNFASDTGSYNTAVGGSALAQYTTGSYNVAVGIDALNANTEGSNNVAVGGYALRGLLYGTITANENTAVGDHAMYEDSEGGVNTAVGANALYHVSSGYSNVAVGYSACWACNGSFENVALGNQTLYNNASGIHNVAIGNAAGYNSTGSYNIEIGNTGQPAESGAIRIGTAGKQTATYVAGITSTQVVGAPVYVTPSGQLGVLASSERYKTAIRSMEPDASKFAQLRPVTFHLKTDPQGTPQYGLIAEEVNKLYPDLVIRDSTGVIQGVRYDEVTSLLLAQMQLMDKKQQAISMQVELLAEQNKLLRAQLEALGSGARLAAQ